MAFPAAGTKKTPRKPFRLNLLSRRDGKHHSDQQANSEYHTLYIDAFSTEAREWLDVESVHQNTYSLGWKRGRRLGLGNFVVVWEGLLKSGQIIALKQMQQGEALLQYEDLKREVYTLLSIRHKNVISYFGIGIESADVYIVMEFVHGETLRSILDRYGPLSYEKSWHYSRQALLGLDYLHNNGIVHRDIRAAKMMVSSKDVVKLIGFGSLKSEETKTLVRH
jgi:serine/threonine protein kinase